MVLMALAPSLIWLFVGRVISRPHGPRSVFDGVRPTSPISRRRKKKPPRRLFGKIGVAFWRRIYFSDPALGGLLGGPSIPRLPFWVAAGIELLPIRSTGC